MTEQIVAQEGSGLANQNMVPTPATLLVMAVQQGADLDRLEKLMALQERWEANEARKAYVAAMSAFKADPPVLTKNKHVRYENSKGTVTEYDHATLDHVSSAIGDALCKHNLSHRWDVQQTDDLIKVRCVITHSLGHSESTSMYANSDTSGGKNSIQGIGSTVTYLERYTLLAAVGMAAGEQDDDGGGAAEIEFITEKQVADLTVLVTEVNANMPKFLEFLGVASLSELPAANYANAVKVLERKRILRAR